MSYNSPTATVACCGSVLHFSMQVRLQIAMVCMVYTVSHPPPWRVRNGLARSTDYLERCEGENEPASALQVLSPNEYLFKV